MKRYAYTALIFAGLLALAGCPYESSEPLDEGTYTNTDWLSGKWKQTKPDGQGEIYILEKGPGLGILFACPVDSLGKKSAVCRTLVLSQLGSTVYASVSYDEENEKGYYIYLFRQKSRSEVEMLPVKENKDIRPESLREFLLKNENNTSIVDINDVMRWRKL